MPPTTKGRLRAELRGARRSVAARRDLSADEHALARLGLGLLESLAPGPAPVVLSYTSLPVEPPTAALNAALAAHGARVLLPVTEPDLDLDWHPLGEDALRLGRDTPATADLVLAPGLAVDLAGTRLGQGGGCYDRALPRRRPGTPVVVLLHPGELRGDPGPGTGGPVDESLPREPHDEPVDGVLTADGWVDLR